MHGAKERSFATLTHARLRAVQGDVEGAKRILVAILTSDPDHSEARSLLTEIQDRVTVLRIDKREEVQAPISAASAGELAGRFRGVLHGRSSADRARRLADWLAALQRHRGRSRVR